MGKLVEQTIRSLFQGVSRQPDLVRLPGQVEEAENVLFSVVSGGFEKRMPAEHVSPMTNAPSGDVVTYMWSRDRNESYTMVIKDGYTNIYDLETGAEKTVTYEGVAQNDAGANPTAIRAYLTNATNAKGFRFATILDTTLVLNTSITVAESADGDVDETTMPVEVKRQGDGSFDVIIGTYANRASGTETTNKDPAFFAAQITDVFYWKDRLGYTSDETVTLSQAGDYFNFWIADFANVVDSDPIKRVAGAGTNTVNVVRHAVPFRASLFVATDKAQFELSGGGESILKPDSAAMDLATTYEFDASARPLVLGDSLFFSAKAGTGATIFEYYYDDSSASNTADDAAKHAQGYIPAPVTRIVGDTVTGTMLLQSGAMPNSLFIYRYYWDGDTKAQSAWGRWDFPSLDEIIHTDFVDGLLRIVARVSDGSMHLFKMSIESEAGPLDHPYAILLDQRTTLTGSYDSGTGLTTWTTPYPHDDDCMVILSSDFPDGKVGRVLNVSHSSTNTITAVGDFSGGEVIVGRRYRARVQLSRQYVREQSDGRTAGNVVASGRLQLRNITFNYEDSAYFEVHVTPQYRAPRVYRFTSRILGSGLDLLGGGLPLDPDGTFRARVNSRGDRVSIEVVSEEPVPFRITSASWVGFFNELTRQE